MQSPAGRQNVALDSLSLFSQMIQAARRFYGVNSKCLGHMGKRQISRAYFKHDFRAMAAIPQGLKPLAFDVLFGTTEVVP
jgi:hypothetical protein